MFPFNTSTQKQGIQNMLVKTKDRLSLSHRMRELQIYRSMIRTKARVHISPPLPWKPVCASHGCSLWHNRRLLIHSKKAALRSTETELARGYSWVWWEKMKAEMYKTGQGSSFFFTAVLSFPKKLEVSLGVCAQEPRLSGTAQCQAQTSTPPPDG